MIRSPNPSSSAPLSTRDALMRELLEVKPAGLTLDELAQRLGVTRNAVRQQVTTLERDGLVVHNGSRPSGRRPSRTYGLTERGLESFPRRYGDLSVALLDAVRGRVGEEMAEEILMQMAEDIAADWLPRLEPLDPQERRTQVVALMNQLGYHASLGTDGEPVSAVNCIYRQLASRNSSVCRFDERLVTLLLGHEVHLTSCMVEGEGACVFSRLTNTAEQVVG